MTSAFAVLLIGAVLASAAAFWVLRAYRRAGADVKAAPRALIASVAVIIASLGVYLAIGRPDLPGQPFEARLAALKQRPLETFSVDEALAVLAEGAREHPEDATPHLLSGRLLFENGRPQEAARSFDAALRRDPQSPDAMIGMGEAIAAIEGHFTPEALALFQQAAERSEAPEPWMYQAMAARQQGRADEARRLWGEALARMPADHPLREVALRMMNQAER